MTQDFFTIGQHVLIALKERLPLVALETAVVTHGLPRPLNLKIALELEELVRQGGAVPCTIGVIQGKIVIGLSAEQLVYLAGQDTALKLGLRDLAFAAVKILDGGTTVSATAYLAHHFGIRIFATGGIGGVHRGACDSMDISSDLPVLGKTPVTVIASGAKSILDLGLTLEYLETAGVTVTGYRTDTFPAFYARSSPYGLEHRLETPAQVAALMHARDELGLSGGVLVCNPAPETEEIPWQELQPLIEEVERQSAEEGVSGPEITPHMLHRLFVVSNGRTLCANQALLRGNALLAAEIAKAHSEQRKRDY